MKYLIIAMLLSGCSKGVRYYDGSSETCDSSKYHCVDVKGIK